MTVGERVRRYRERHREQHRRDEIAERIERLKARIRDLRAQLTTPPIAGSWMRSTQP
jgi:hypothetical protein